MVKERAMKEIIANQPTTKRRNKPVTAINIIKFHNELSILTPNILPITRNNPLTSMPQIEANQVVADIFCESIQIPPSGNPA